MVQTGALNEIKHIPKLGIFARGVGCRCRDLLSEMCGPFCSNLVPC